MTTYRERKEARVENLREWAGKREQRASAVFEANRPFTEDYAFNTQPGHIPVRARIIAQEDRAHDSLRKAQGMVSRAAGIESQLDSSIYDDDPDAIERLEERVAALEAKREKIKADNAAFRKAHPELRALSAYERGQAMPHAGYELTNLSGNIKRNRDRLVVVRQRKARQERSEAAGGVAVEQRASGYCSVTFAEKPSRDVIDALKVADFHWNKGSWWGKTDALPDKFTTTEGDQQ
ncbi:MAG: DUF3560 domain-containing protein [Pseudomonadota bacterium]